MPALSGSTVLVTGASKRLGQAVAFAFAKRGARLLITARDVDALGETAELLDRLGAEYRSAKLDVTAYDDCEAAVRRAIDTFGSLDVVINVASAGTGEKDVRDESAEDIASSIDTTLRGAVYVTKAALEPFLEDSRGTILNVSSVGGQLGFPSRAGPVYGAAKAGVIRFCERTDELVSNSGVRVLCFVPGSMRPDAIAGKASSYAQAAEAIVEQVLAGERSRVFEPR